MKFLCNFNCREVEPCQQKALTETCMIGFMQSLGIELKGAFAFYIGTEWRQFIYIQAKKF